MGTDDERDFEAEVLRVARALYTPESAMGAVPEAAFQGATDMDGQERDGVFVSEDFAVVVEATVSRHRDKAVKDGTKLEQACAKLARQYPYKGIKGFFVTRDEPTQHQRAVIDRLRGPIVACSFAQFHSLLVNASDYLDARSNYPFGSAREPGTDDFRSLDQYVQIDLTQEGNRGRSWSARQIAGQLQEGGRTVLLGDYGTGKSMTLREVFLALAAEYRKRKTARFPILLNLRDHQGQHDPDEAFARHARRLGFGQPSRLTRAWLAGDVHVILDGFDEIATPGWLGKTSGLRDIRRRSVELIRHFFEYAPRSSGLLVSGRSHFFDSIEEMRSGLRLPDDSLVLQTNDYTEQQLRDYLVQRGWTQSIPEWLPARPLLVGYLTARNLLAEVIDLRSHAAAAEGWNLLLDRISEREAALEPSVSGPLVRQILEYLATIARGMQDGMGPLSAEDLTNAFRDVCGYAPDEGSYQLLQRLPGLGVQDPTDGSRHFIDASLADALRAGDVARYARKPLLDGALAQLRGTATVLDQLGVEVATTQLGSSGIGARQAISAAKQLQATGGNDACVLDLVRIALEMGLADVSMPVLGIDEVVISYLSVEGSDGDLGNLAFSNCIIQTLDLSEYDRSATLPTFTSCMFGLVSGAGSPDALPPGRFIDCAFDQFDTSSLTTKGILHLDTLTPQQRVALTILKKLYIQRGSGRRESALSRGMDTGNKAHVDSALRAITSEGLAARTRLAGNPVYVRTRGSIGRVRRMLDAPSAASDDGLMRRLR